MSVMEIFRLVAAEFASVSDEKVNTWIDLTAPLISKKIFGKLYEQALALLTAHRMKMSGYGDSTYGNIGDALRIGSYSEGETSVSFTANQSLTLLVDADLTMTQYGVEYLSLRRRVIIPIRTAGEAR